MQSVVAVVVVVVASVVLVLVVVAAAAAAVPDDVVCDIFVSIILGERIHYSTNIRNNLFPL